MAEPIIAFNLLFGLMLLRNAAIVAAQPLHRRHRGQPRALPRIRAELHRPRHRAQPRARLREVGAAIAKEALKTGGSVYDLVLQKGWLTKEELDDVLTPENMTSPRRVAAAAKPKRG